MSYGPSHLPRWRFIPILGWSVWEWLTWRMEQREPRLGPARQHAGHPDLPVYPIDVSSKLALTMGYLDADGVACCAAEEYPAPYHPTRIALYGLARWNAYLETGASEHQQSFMVQARWFVAHECRLGDDMGGWPLPCAWDDYHTPQRWLSALTQGQAISVLVRAYRLTGDETFLSVARRAVRTFQRDILDGGVSTPVGAGGVLFEEVAVYPAAHILNGFILALFGLYDYIAVTGDAQITALIRRAHAGLHHVIEEYDTGYWSRYELLHGRLARPFYHELHVTLLEVLAERTGCGRCAARAARWRAYIQSRSAQMRYFVVSRRGRYVRALGRHLRALASGRAPRASDASVDASGRQRVLVPIAAFPVAGGTRGVLAGIAHAMSGVWELEYLTQQVGRARQQLVIHRFGLTKTHPWQFPNVWLYVIAGCAALARLLRPDVRRYRLIMPQDGSFTGAFSAIVGRLAGVRVMCLDHGNVTLAHSRAFRAERRRALDGRSKHNRIVSRLRFTLYWPSLRLLTWLAVRVSDHFLPAGDDVEEALLARYRIRPSQISRFPFMMDIERFTPPGPEVRAEQRARLGIPAEAVVIVMINRLAVEKGLDVALQGIDQALVALPSGRHPPVRAIIAGDGPLRAQVEAEIRRRRLGDLCTLWGEAMPEDVRLLLGIGDIFLYSGTRGINPVAVLEAMAAGCGVIATTAPEMVARYLDEGRGIAIPPADAGAIARALVRLICDREQCRAMGRQARNYVAKWHTATQLRRALLRATFWAPAIPESTPETTAVSSADEHSLQPSRRVPAAAGEAEPTPGAAALPR